MKTINTLLLAAATAVSFTVVNVVRADEATLSPRARENQIRRVMTPDTSPNLVSNTYRGTAARAELNRAKVVPSGTVTPNLISGNYAGAGTKNPYYKAEQFEVAPMAKPEKK